MYIIFVVYDNNKCPDIRSNCVYLTVLFSRTLVHQLVDGLVRMSSVRAALDITGAVGNGCLCAEELVDTVPCHLLHAALVEGLLAGIACTPVDKNHKIVSFDQKQAYRHIRVLQY